MQLENDMQQAAPLTGADRKRALASRAKEKQAQFRAKHHLRKDGWTPPDERLDAAERVAGFLLKRVEFPKYGEPRKLTATDRDEGRACVMLALTHSGFFDHGFLSARIFRDARNKLNGPQGLRLRRTREFLSDDIAATAADAGFITEYEETGPRLSLSQVETARLISRTLRASRDADPSRKARSAYKSHREFFALLISSITGKRARAMTGGTFCKRKERFLDYLQAGAVALRDTPLDTSSAATEIMRALETRAFATL
jgi:hypothetical protein